VKIELDLKLSTVGYVGFRIALPSLQIYIIKSEIYSQIQMAQSAIFSPFFARILLTLIVWVYMYIRRLSLISGLKINQQELAAPGILENLSPPSVINPSDNLKNLFEIPVLFYAIVLYLFVTKQVDSMYVNTAWIFFGFRAVHSAVHCTFNLISLRFSAYIISTLAIWFMAIRAISSHLTLL
jgi:hypothetical protein